MSRNNKNRNNNKIKKQLHFDILDDRYKEEETYDDVIEFFPRILKRKGNKERNIKKMRRNMEGAYDNKERVEIIKEFSSFLTYMEILRFYYNNIQP